MSDYQRYGWLMALLYADKYYNWACKYFILVYTWLNLGYYIILTLTKQYLVNTVTIKSQSYFGFRYNKQHSPFWIFSMALSTPKGTPTSSDSPTTKVTSRESNKRPPHHPWKCTEEQKPDSINSVPKGAVIMWMHFLWITATFWTFKISRRTMYCGPFVRIVIAFAFDLYSPHDPSIFCKLLPSEAQQLNLVVGSRTICTFKDNKLMLKEAFCVLGLAFYISQREKITMFLTLLCLSG